MNTKYFMSKVWYPVFDGEGDDGSKGKEDDKGGGDDKTYTQADVDKITADNNKQSKAQQQKLIDELEAIKTKASLTDQERSELEERLELLNNNLLTKDELAKKEKDKLEKGYKKQVQELSEKYENLNKRYTGESISRSITDAAVANNAFAPEQIVAILSSKARMVEDLDADGKPTGKHIPKIQFDDTNKDGKAVTLDLTISEAVKRMAELDKYLNLFKSDKTAGLGSGSRSGGKEMDIAELAKDPAAYRKARKEGKIDF